MDKQQMQEVIAEVLRDADLHSGDIPAIDLYLDQILSLVADNRATASSYYQDKPLTKTMVNNYSKDGLIKPVKGKKYAKEHIVQMLLVYALKSSMPIGEIKRMLTGVDEIEGFEDSDLIACYDRYLDTKEDVRAMSRDVVERLLAEQELEVENDRDFLVFLLSLVALSSYTNGIARALIAARYPDPELLERERRERADEERAREKEERKQEKEEKKKKKDKDKEKDKDKDKEKETREEEKSEESIENDVGAKTEA